MVFSLLNYKDDARSHKHKILTVFFGTHTTVMENQMPILIIIIIVHVPYFKAV